MKLKPSQTPSSSSQESSKDPLSVVITSDLETSTPTSDTNSEKQTVSEDKYRQHMRGLLGDIILEYVSNDTTVSPYDFISDIRTELYGLQDYFQDNLNRVNAILAYLDGQQSPHLFHRNKPNGHWRQVCEAQSCAHIDARVCTQAWQSSPSVCT